MEPVRTCVGCRTRANKSSLVRVVVRNSDLVVDQSATEPGRGAWVHPTVHCIENSLKRGAFGRALKVKTAANNDALRHYLAASVSHRETPDTREQAERHSEQIMSENK